MSKAPHPNKPTEATRKQRDAAVIGSIRGKYARKTETKRDDEHHGISRADVGKAAAKKFVEACDKFMDAHLDGKGRVRRQKRMFHSFMRKKQEPMPTVSLSIVVLRHHVIGAIEHGIIKQAKSESSEGWEEQIVDSKCTTH
jgi:hypothetical protein